MKVAIIIERANIDLGGAERSIFELAGALGLLDVDVKILAASGQAQSPKLHILFSDSGKRANINDFSGAIVEYLKKEKFDIVHSTLPFDFADIYQPRGGSYAEAAIRNAASYNSDFQRKIKTFTTFLNFKRTALVRRERRLCQKENGPIVACLSEYVREQFKKHYNLPDSRLRVINNGVKIVKEIDKTRVDKLRAQIMTSFKIKEADKPGFFLFAANNFRLKGLLPLIKSIAAVKKENTERPAFLIVAGRGEISKYKAIAASEGVKDRVLFMGQAANIQNLLALSDIAVLPTYYDPASRFILEGIGAEKPVITTKFNGAADLFFADRHGKVIDSPDNVAGLAEAVKYFCNTENINAAKKAIAEDDLKSKVSINAHCEKLFQLYNDIINNRK